MDSLRYFCRFQFAQNCSTNFAQYHIDIKLLQTKNCNVVVIICTYMNIKTSHNVCKRSVKTTLAEFNSLFQHVWSFMFYDFRNTFGVAFQPKLYI